METQYNWGASKCPGYGKFTVKILSPIFDQWPIFDWPPIPIFQNLLTDMFSGILTKYFGQIWCNCLQPRLTTAYLTK